MKPLLLLAMLTLPLLQTPPVNNGVLEGKVTRPSSPEGIPDVQVTLIGPSPVATAATVGAVNTPNAGLTPAMLELQLLGLPLALGANPAQQPQTAVVTDREGGFSFKNLAPGRYQIRAQRDGYFGTPLPGAAGAGVPTIVNTTATITAGQPTPAIAIEMLKGAIVTGRVRDPNGQLLSTTQVTAYQIGYQNGRKTILQLNAKQTDDRGEYRLFWLPPGDYLIGAVPRRLGIVTAAPTAQDSYARTFFPNTVDARQAQIVHADDGAEISGIDIGIRPDATGRISGRVITSVVGPNGQTPIASTFYLFSLDPSALGDSSLTTAANTSPNRAIGQFELRGILPGQYELMANLQGSNGRPVWGRTRVNVNGEVNDVVLSIQPGVEVHARMTVDGALPAYTMQTQQGLRGAVSFDGLNTLPQQVPAAPVPTPTYRVQLRSVENFGIVAPFENAANQDIVFDPASGTTVFKNVLPGKYAVNIQPLPPNGYVADIRAAGASAIDSGIDINSQTGEIQIALKTDGKRIQGVVRDASQKAVASVRVALVPASPSRRQNIQLFKTALTDNSGNFSLFGIAPGDYKLFAWEAVPNSAWMNAEFLELYESRGQLVTLGATPTVNVELKLIPREGERR